MIERDRKRDTERKRPQARLFIGVLVFSVVTPVGGCLLVPPLKCNNDGHCFDTQMCATELGVCIPRIAPAPETPIVDGGEEDAGTDPEPNPDGGSPLDGGGAVDGGLTDLDAGPDGGVIPQNPWGFEVETIVLDSLIDPDSAGTLNLAQCAINNEVVLNTSTLQFGDACGLNGANLTVRDSLTGGGQFAVLAARTILVPQGITFRIHGNRRMVLAAIDDVVVDGTIDATGKMIPDAVTPTSDPGPGGSQATVCGAPQTGANGRDGEETNLRRGAGGGGAGGVTAGSPGGAAGNGDLGGVGGDMLQPSGLALIGGCSGGTGSGGTGGGGDDHTGRGQGGSGGGGLHIIAGGIVSGTGTANVSGSGGTGALDQKIGGGGGGSGGSLWFTATTLSLPQLTTLASGGGGSGGAPEEGNGFSTNGATAVTPSVALGGGVTLAIALDKQSGVGGIGGGIKFPSGGADANGTKGGGGGGGGGAGRLIFDVRGTQCAVPTKILGDIVTVGGCAPPASVCGDGTRDLPEQCDFGAFNLPAGDIACGCSETCTWQPCEVITEDDPFTNATFLECYENEEDCFVDGEGAMDEAGVVVSCFPGGALCDAGCTDVNRCQFMCPSGTCLFTCNNMAGQNPQCDAYCGPASTCTFSECTIANGCATHGASDFPAPGDFLP